jgi:hypothetical protein
MPPDANASDATSSGTHVRTPLNATRGSNFELVRGCGCGTVPADGGGFPWLTVATRARPGNCTRPGENATRCRARAHSRRARTISQDPAALRAQLGSSGTSDERSGEGGGDSASRQPARLNEPVAEMRGHGQAVPDGPMGARGHFYWLRTEGFNPPMAGDRQPFRN